MSWGSLPWITEHLANGTLVFNALVAHGVSPVYRASKAPWVGKPIDNPTVWSYAKDSSSQTVFYASWNGATEVSAWRFYGAEDSTGEASWNVVGQRKRTGFETVYSHSTYSKFVFAEALAINGTSLRNSSMTRTFVPGSELAKHCDDFQCPNEIIRRTFAQPQVGEVGKHDKTRPIYAMPMNYLGRPTPNATAIVDWAFIAIGFACIILELFKIFKMATQALQKLI